MSEVRLIDANALIEKAWDADTRCGYVQVVDVGDIEAAPTIDPVKHGRWEWKDDPYEFFDKIPVCSECGCTTKYREITAFCPHCGARMDGEEG